VLLRLLTIHQLEIRWIWAGLRCVLTRRSMVGEELPAGFSMPGSGGHGESLRRNHGDAAGVEPGA